MFSFNAMKRFAVIFILSSVVGALGLAVEKTYNFDMVDWDSETKNIQEPDGTMAIKVTAPEGTDEADIDQIYNQEIHPQLINHRNRLKHKMIQFDRALDDDDLDDEGVRSQLNQAHDAYHEAWSDATSSVISGFHKSWGKKKSKKKKTTTTTESKDGSTTHTETTTTTKTTSSSVSVGVDPVPAVMGLTGLFKKKKEIKQPEYYQTIQELLDNTNKLNKECASAGKEMSRIMKNPPHSGQSEKEAAKAIDKAVKSLKNAKSHVQKMTSRFSDVWKNVKTASAQGALEDPHFGSLLQDFSAKVPPAQQLNTQFNTHCQRTQSMSGQPGPFSDELDTLSATFQDLQQAINELQGLAYEISRDLEH